MKQNTKKNPLSLTSDNKREQHSEPIENRSKCTDLGTQENACEQVVIGFGSITGLQGTARFFSVLFILPDDIKKIQSKRELTMSD